MSIKSKIIMGEALEQGLLYPARDFHFDLGRRIHSVPDTIVRTNLMQDICDLYGDTWWSCLIHKQGRGVVKSSKPVQRYELGEERRQWLIDLTTRLNLELNGGGHWVTGFDDGQSWFMLFRDSDGDLQFEVSGDDPWARMRQWPLETFLHKAYDAGLAWSEVIFKLLEVKPHEMIKAAQGEPTRATVH